MSPYVYNSSNQLTSIPGTTYGYDNNGNLTSKSDGTQYTWDFENRLTQVTLPGTGGTVTFKYDPFGRRIEKSFVQGGITNATGYEYDGANVLDTFPVDGTVGGETYTLGPGIDEPLFAFSWPNLNSRASPNNGPGADYYEPDGLGSITSLSDSAGTLANTYTYDSFGKLTASTGTQNNPFQYTGREFDSETGIYNYRARYYDQNVGRFISEDPIAFKGGIDFYAYVKNRPVTFIDPMGTCLLQFDSVTSTLGKCGVDPNRDRQCACLCSISPEYQKCIKDCKDGCLASTFNAVEVCQCLCNKGRESGELNGFEAWVCKQLCKRGGK